MEHKHEALIGLDGIIKCRTCGQILPYAEEVLGNVPSIKVARRILDEIAIKGGHSVSAFADGFVVYTKDQDGIREEVSCRRISSREYQIYKRLVSKT